ncbi:MAG: sugar ABC transporter ATP-binding protein [Planctomycetota bacterium]
MVADPSAPLLRMKNISKSFPGVKALSEVDLEVSAGEVLAIIGENGAGKSTLIKILGGAHQADQGSIEINGEPVDVTTPLRSRATGISVIYQEFNLVPFLTVRENIFLGNAIHSGGIINAKTERVRCVELFEKLGIEIDPDAVVSSLSIAQQQVVEIAKALNTDVKILVMDEPSATLTPSEVSRLFDIVAELSSRGIAVIYISHRLDEILSIADRVLVLRDGEKVVVKSIPDTNRREMIELMVGRSIENEYPKQSQHPGNVCLQVEGLTWQDRVHDVSFSVCAGEVVGITGLVGAGRTEVARLLAGAEKPDAGTISIDGSPVIFDSPLAAIRAGVCLLTEDRKGQGLTINHPVVENFGLPNLDHFSNAGVMNLSAELTAFEQFVLRIQIKVASTRQLAGQLSGGNQQKLVLAKWLQRDCNIIIVDEPTRGVDVGAKYEIYLLINELAKQGKAIIMISSEMDEVLGMSDRIIVMRQGRISGEIGEPEVATQKQIMELAAQ